MFIILLFSINVAFAHPGRTDSNGGHWDHDTGEYHYHDGEYASQSGGSSSSSSSNSSSSSFSPNKWYERGLEDGLRQKCIEHNYKASFISAYKQACRDFAESHPLFNLLIKYDNRDILYPTVHYVSDSEYEEIRSEYFDNYYIPSYYTYYDERSAYSNYVKGYDESYDNATLKNISKEYFTITEALQAKEDGYDDGCEHFTSATLYAYKECYPLESFFVLLPTYALVLIPLTILFFLLVIVLLIRSKRKKAESDTEAKAEIAAAQIHHEEPDSKTISAPSESNRFTIGTDFSAGYVEFVPETLTSYIRILPAKGIKENSIIRIVKPEIIKLDTGDIVYVYDCEIKPYT